MTPGERLKALRNLVGATREEMCEKIAIGYVRYANVEQSKVRMSVEDLESVVIAFPEFESFMVRGARVDLATLKKSKSEFVKQIYKRIEAGDIAESQLKVIVNR